MMKLEQYAPPGFNWQRELKWICTGLSAAVLNSLKFLFSYQNAYNSLYRRVGAVKKLYDGAVMVDFHEVVGGSFMVFPVVALCLLAAILLHYAYYYQGSRSIYLMRRLPNRWELHIRCIAMPFAAMLAGILMFLIILLIYYWIYIALTPGACLTPNQWAKLWDAWIGA